MSSLYDVAIIGGGPAGSTAATFLARNGRKVIVLEKEKIFRFRIGESLLPHSMGAFERLGVREKLDRQFLWKYGAEIGTVCGTFRKVYFKEGFRATQERSYQVTRADFDQLLLDHSAENSAEVRRGALVESLEFTPDDIGITYQLAGAQQNLRARYLLDCSGRNALVGNYFKLKRHYDNLKKFAVFAHYENVTRDSGNEGGFIRLVQGRDRWFWMIPLTPTKMSVGMVMSIENFKALKKAPEAALEDSLREQPTIWSRMTHSTRVTEVHSASDFSYRNTTLAGELWLLAGDAAGFIDPVFSTGVFLAIRSGEEAAQALEQAFNKPNRRATAFRQYERSVNRVMNLYLRFVNNWYKPQFASVITHPVDRFQVPATVNTVLAGNLSSDFAIWWRMQIFYFVVFLQKYLPLCPNKTLVPQTQKAAVPPMAAEPVKTM
jgi:flavin-dependent dehydrogenase